MSPHFIPLIVAGVLVWVLSSDSEKSDSGDRHTAKADDDLLAQEKKILRKRMKEITKEQKRRKASQPASSSEEIK